MDWIFCWFENLIAYWSFNIVKKERETLCKGNSPSYHRDTIFFFFFFFGDLISWKIWSIQVGYLSHSIGIVFGTLAYILKSLSSLLSLLLCMISSFVLFDFQSSCFSSQNEKFLPYNQRKVVKSSKPKTQRCEVTNSQWRI